MELYRGGVTYRSPESLPMISRRTGNSLLESLLVAGTDGDSLEPDDVIELEIVIPSTRVNARELSALLAVIDSVYGRVVTRDYLSSYSKNREDQLVVEVKSGSIVLIIRDLIAAGDSAVAIIVVLYFLQFLRPRGLREMGEAYEKFQTGRLRKAEAKEKEYILAVEKNRREKIRTFAKENAVLGTLPPRQRNEFVRTLDGLYEREERKLPRLKRILLLVRDIKIRIKPKDRK